MMTNVSTKNWRYRHTNTSFIVGFPDLLQKEGHVTLMIHFGPAPK